MEINFRIDPEFQAQIPPISLDEKAILEASLLADGCRDALVVWQEEGLLVDGHNRFEICQKHGLQYPVIGMSFKDREAALDWIDSNQLGRRNLTPDQMKLIRGRRYNRMKKREGRPSKLDQNDLVSGETAEVLSKQHGVSPATIKRDGKAAEILEQHPEKAAAIIRGEVKMADAIREIKKEDYQKKVAEIVSKPIPQEITGPFDIILADPPWRYDFSETHQREIENHYTTASVEEISNHKPDSADSAVLLLWATAPKLQEALEVMTSWGFEYKTHAVWDKEKLGMGYWFRGQHELLLVGTKGKASPPPEFCRVGSVFREIRQNHSRKPECVYEWIEKAFIEKSKLEMYARELRPGWAVWGNEV